MKRQGETLNAYYLVKEANLERLNPIGLQLYDILKKAKPWIQRLEGGGRDK